MKRAERFGIAHPELEEQKKRERAERFGLSHPAIEEQKKRERAERFGIVKEEDKLEARKQRFKGQAGGAGGGAPKVASEADLEFEAKKKVCPGHRSCHPWVFCIIFYLLSEP